MRIGAIFPTIELCGDPSQVRDFAQAVEGLGYSHLVVLDHVLGVQHERREPPLWGPYTEHDPFHEPLTLLAYLAAVTERIELVTGVLVLPMRQTALAAKQLAEIDLLSRGRLRVGLGSGWNWVEYQGLNADFEGRGRVFDEQVELVRRLWEEPLVDFAGSFHRIDRACVHPRPARRIPLWFGAMSPVALRRAARLGDGMIFGFAEASVYAMARDVLERVAAAGREPAAFGLESSVRYAKGASAWEAARAEWEELGGSHFDVSTGDPGAEWAGEPVAGLVGAEEHVRALEHFKAVIGTS